MPAQLHASQWQQAGRIENKMNHYRIQPLALFAFHSCVPTPTVTRALQASLTLQTYFGTNSIQSYYYALLFLPKYFDNVCVYFSLLSSTSKALSLSNACDSLRYEQVHVWHMYRCSIYTVPPLGLYRVLKQIRSKTSQQYISFKCQYACWRRSLNWCYS